MEFVNIQNLLLTEKYNLLIKEIKSCDDSLYKKGIKMYCNYHLKNKKISRYNPYFYFLLKKDLGRVILDLYKINNFYARYYLGIYNYDNGNYTQALEFFSDYSDPCSLSYKGQIHIELNEIQKGIMFFNNSKEYILSSFYLANCYLNNFGVKFDFEMCESLYKYCVDYEYTDAYYNLSYLYLTSSQVKYGPKYCLDLMEKAAYKYHTKSYMYVLYYYYQRDNDKFEYWFNYLKNSHNDELISLIANDFSKGHNFAVDQEKAKILYALR